MNQSAGPLSGIKVLDASRVLAGPFCCQLLAELGADVVKLERPGTGDDTRQWGPPFVADDGPSAYYLSCNRAKRSLALELSHDDARGVLDDLVRQSDVLVENFRPESLAKLGLSPQRLHELNPRLVVCSISGYGRTGPLANVPGYDLVIQAVSGLMSITGPAEGPPMKVGVAITDVITGLYAAVSALAGLQARQHSSRHWSFDLALADCTLASLVNVAQGARITGQLPQRLGNAHPHIVPYQAFASADGHFVLAVGNDRQWLRFCRAVGHDLWTTDERFATNPARVRHREELVKRLDELFVTQPTEHWLRLLNEAAVPHAPIRSLDEVFAQPQTQARGMTPTVTDAHGRELPLLGNPVHWEGQAQMPPQAPPELGEHTDEVLREWLGYSDELIAGLRRRAVVA